MKENEGVKIEGSAEEHPEGIEPQGSYVVHGAQAYCPFGSRYNRLVVERCHGTYIHDMPLLSVEDKTTANIQCFGFCYCMENPDRMAEAKKVKETVDKAGGLVSKIVSFFFRKKDEDKVTDEMLQQVTVVCKPLFDSNGWLPVTEEMFLKGRPALTTRSTILCLKGGASGGMIQIIDDGQKNAAYEQSQPTEDFSSWTEAEGMPEPSQKNLEALAAHIGELEQALKKETASEKRKALEAEIEAKKCLKTQMTDTKTILNDLEIQSNFVREVTDFDGEMAVYEEAGILKQMVESGNASSEEEAKEQLKQQLTESDQKAKELAATKEQVRSQYEEGKAPTSYTNEIATDIAERSEGGTKPEELCKDPTIYLDGKMVSEQEIGQKMKEQAEEAKRLAEEEAKAKKENTEPWVDIKMAAPEVPLSEG